MTGGNDEGLKLPPMKDVVVIGGGIVGVCAAVVLARAGRDVVVIERGDIGGATSFGNAGVMADSYVAVANNPDLWNQLGRLPSITFSRRKAAANINLILYRHSRTCRGNPSTIMRKHCRQFNVAAAPR